MKRGFIIATIVASSFTGYCQNQFYTCWDIGSSTKKVPVIGMYFGYEMCTDKTVSAFAEVGIRAHVTMKKYIKFGSINAGLKFNVNRLSLAPLIGFVIGGDQQKQDRHVIADSVSYLEHGATSANFITMLGSVRCGWKISEDCSLYMQGVYCNHITFLGVGVNIKL